MNAIAWQHLAFEEAVRDVSGGNRKVQKGDYLSAGAYPVVDQGQELVGGYCNDNECLVSSSGPWVIFGDHTRAVKYLDRPFCMGADGVKVLTPRDPRRLDAKFLYWFLAANEVPSAGYSRHFKFLKRLHVPLPPLDEQRRIASILDKADALRQMRKRATALLDTLTQSIFFEMFGALDWTASRFESLLAKPLRNGLSPSMEGTIEAHVLTLSAVTGDVFKPGERKLAPFKQPPPLDQRVDTGDFLICRGNGNKKLVGVGKFPTNDMPDTAFPDTIIGARIDQSTVEPAYLQHVWHSTPVRKQIEAGARTTNGTFKVNQQILEAISIPVPPRALQAEFAKRSVALELQRQAMNDSLSQLDLAFESLQHRAFSGQL